LARSSRLRLDILPRSIGLRRPRCGLKFWRGLNFRKPRTRGLRIPIGRRKTGKVDLDEPVAPQHFAGLQALLAVVQDDHPARRELLHRDVGAAPVKCAAVINHDQLVLSIRVPHEGIDPSAHTSNGVVTNSPPVVRTSICIAFSALPTQTALVRRSIP
jgi:hypothetical protein